MVSSGSPGASAGATLVELMVVVVIIAIIAAIAAPNFTQLVERQRAKALRAEMTGLFRKARTRAIDSGNWAVVCPLASNNRCSNDWKLPLVAFVDGDNDQAYSASHDMQLGRLDTDKTRHLKHVLSGRSFFRFSGRGMASSTFGSLRHCPPDQEHAWFSLIVARTGRVRSQPIKSSTC